MGRFSGCAKTHRQKRTAFCRWGSPPARMDFFAGDHVQWRNRRSLSERRSTTHALELNAVTFCQGVNLLERAGQAGCGPGPNSHDERGGKAPAAARTLRAPCPSRAAHRQRIEELVGRGGDASRSKALLELFEETLARHYKDRDQLRSKLPKANNRRR
jgi:hypothetical protein